MVNSTINSNVDNLLFYLERNAFWGEVSCWESLLILITNIFRRICNHFNYWCGEGIYYDKETAEAAIRSYYQGPRGSEDLEQKIEKLYRIVLDQGWGPGEFEQRFRNEFRREVTGLIQLRDHCEERHHDLPGMMQDLLSENVESQEGTFLVNFEVECLKKELLSRLKGPSLQMMQSTCKKLYQIITQDKELNKRYLQEAIEEIWQEIKTEEEALAVHGHHNSNFLIYDACVFSSDREEALRKLNDITDVQLKKQGCLDLCTAEAEKNPLRAMSIMQEIVRSLGLEQTILKNSLYEIAAMASFNKGDYKSAFKLVRGVKGVRSSEGTENTPSVIRRDSIYYRFIKGVLVLNAQNKFKSAIALASKISANEFSRNFKDKAHFQICMGLALQETSLTTIKSQLSQIQNLEIRAMALRCVIKARRERSPEGIESETLTLNELLQNYFNEWDELLHCDEQMWNGNAIFVDAITRNAIFIYAELLNAQLVIDAPKAEEIVQNQTIPWLNVLGQAFINLHLSQIQRDQSQELLSQAYNLIASISDPTIRASCIVRYVLSLFSIDQDEGIRVVLVSSLTGRQKKKVLLYCVKFCSELETCNRLFSAVSDLNSQYREEIVSFEEETYRDQVILKIALEQADEDLATATETLSHLYFSHYGVAKGSKNCLSKQVQFFCALAEKQESDNKSLQLYKTAFSLLKTVYDGELVLETPFDRHRESNFNFDLLKTITSSCFGINEYKPYQEEPMEFEKFLKLTEP